MLVKEKSFFLPSPKTTLIFDYLFYKYVINILKHYLINNCLNSLNFNSRNSLKVFFKCKLHVISGGFYFLACFEQSLHWDQTVLFVRISVQPCQSVSLSVISLMPDWMVVWLAVFLFIWTNELGLKTIFVDCFLT